MVLCEADSIWRSQDRTETGRRPLDAGDERGRTRLDVDVRDAEGASPLHLAAAAGHLEAVDFLCEAGADVNASDGAGQACVWRAASNGQVR